MGLGRLQEGETVFCVVVGGERIIEKNGKEEAALAEGGNNAGLFAHNNTC